MVKPSRGAAALLRAAVGYLHRAQASTRDDAEAALANRRAVSRAAAWARCPSRMRAEPKIETAELQDLRHRLEALRELVGDQPD